MVILGGLRPPLATRQAQDEEKDLKLLTLTLSLSKGEGRPKAAKGEGGSAHERPGHGGGLNALPGACDPCLRRGSKHSENG